MASPTNLDGSYYAACCNLKSLYLKAFLKWNVVVQTVTNTNQYEC